MRLLIAIIALLACSTSWAALRGTTSSTCGSCASIATTYSGSAIQVGDLIVLVTSAGNGGSTTYTSPTGFTNGSALSPAIPDVAFDGPAVQYHLAVKIAAAGDTGTPTYTTSIGYTAGWGAQQIRVYSGRVNSSIGAAFNNQVATAATGTQSMNYTMSVTGLTALSGDDLVEFVFSSYAAGGTGHTITSAITGFSNSLVSYDNSNNGHGWIASLDSVNHASGATGTLSDALSSSGGGDTGNFTAFVLALPQSAGASCTHSGITSAGAIAVPTASTTVVRLASGALSTVDCSSVSYKQSSGAFGVN